MHTSKLFYAMCTAAALSRLDAMRVDTSAPVDPSGTLRGSWCARHRRNTKEVADTVARELHARWRAGLVGEEYDAAEGHNDMLAAINRLDDRYHAHDGFWQEDAPFVADADYTCPRAPGHKYGTAAVDECGTEPCSLEQLVRVANEYNWVQNAQDTNHVQRDIFSLRPDFLQRHVELHKDAYNWYKPLDHQDHDRRLPAWREVFGDGGWPHERLKTDRTQPKCEWNAGGWTGGDGRCCSADGPVDNEVCDLRAGGVLSRSVEIV